jgi:hypothetical protein
MRVIFDIGSVLCWVKLDKFFEAYGGNIGRDGLKFLESFNKLHDCGLVKFEDKVNELVSDMYGNISAYNMIRKEKKN